MTRIFLMVNPFLASVNCVQKRLNSSGIMDIYAKRYWSRTKNKKEVIK